MLHRAFIILTLLLGTLSVHAASSEQELASWDSNSSFAKSDEGKATLGHLLVQNGMPLSGFDLILSTNPSKLSPALLKTVSLDLKNSLFIQKGWMQTSGGWKKIYNNESVSIKIKSSKDIQSAFAKANRIPKDNVNQKARILWQIATQAPQINQVGQSLKALKLLKQSPQTAIGQDLISSTKARVLYQKGDLTGADAAFNEIPKASSLWVQALEERTWTSLRSDDYDKAVGETVTLLSPAIAPLVGPESFYLANLTSLKVCDYSRIFKNSETFKKRQRDHLQALQDLSNTGTNKYLESVLNKFDQKGVSVENAGPEVGALPRLAFRDSKFVRFMESRRQWLSEGKKAESLKINLAQNSAQIADRLKQLAVQRVRALSEIELKEYRQNIDKMHIIEGEVIQRLAVDESLKGERSKLAKVEDSGDVLVFPYSSDEVWFDELDNYKARVKDCPTLKGAAL